MKKIISIQRSDLGPWYVVDQYQNTCYFAWRWQALLYARRLQRQALEDALCKLRPAIVETRP